MDFNMKHLSKQVLLILMLGLVIGSFTNCSSSKEATKAGIDEAYSDYRDGLYGTLDFDKIVPVLAKENVGHEWWTVDLCFWPEAWDATEKCKTALDALVSKYG